MAGFVKADVLGDEPAGGMDAVGRSTQLPEDTWNYDKTGAKEPPYNLDALALFLEINTWHYRCVPPGTLVMLEGGIEKPVEDVREGDRAIASDGCPHTVFRTMSRPHSGHVVELRVEGSSLPLAATPEHPIYCLRHAPAPGAGEAAPPDYVPAGEIQKGDWVATPLRTRGSKATVTVNGWTIDADMARLLGWYLAEGSVTVCPRSGRRSRNVRVSFCFSSHEAALVERVRRSLERCFELGGSISAEERKHTLQLVVMSPRVARFLVEMGGVGCDEKRIHPDLMKALTKPLALDLLRAYFEGDGHARPPSPKGGHVLSFVTTSPVLARQARALLEDLDYAPLYRASRPPNPARRTRYVVYLTGSDAELFLREDEERRERGDRDVRDAERFLRGEPGAQDATGKDLLYRDGKVFRRVQAVTRVAYRGPVYNLEIEGDPSYLANGFLVHNCVKAKAISTAGLGYELVVPEGVEKPNEEHKKVLQRFFECPNEEQTWGEILENVLTDFEALGNGYFEVLRNRFGSGPPQRLYHIPAVTMRVRKDRKGFIQQRDNKMVYFRNFGSDPKSPDSFDPRDKDKPLEKRRLLNEVIHLKNYHPRSSYYGLPDFLPALRALVGNKKAGDFNIQFFENNAVPQYAILVKGGELARGARKRIEEYFRTHIKGQAHKTLILEVVQEEGGEKVDIEIKPLSVEIKDASFQTFRADNAEEIRVAHGVPGRLIGLTEKGGLGGAGEGETQQEIFKYHVIEPKQSRLEYRINNFLIKQGFGIQDWELRFKEIDVTDESKVSENVQKLVRVGVLTINEARKMLLLRPLKEAGANVPFIMTSMGPLSLSTLAEGGVPLPMVPQDGGKELVDSLVSLQKCLRAEL